MNLSKSREFFQPETVREPIHIVGCGSVGSAVAENLARCGIANMTLWDMDTVEPHNVGNQMFDARHIGKNKADALKEILANINPDAEVRITVRTDGWNGELLQGFLFLCVDNIDLRRNFVEKHMFSPYVRAVFDFRTMLTESQHYAADWSSMADRKRLLNSMQFSHEEAKAATPVSACGVTLGVVTTVRMIALLGVNNFINFMKGDGLKRFILADGFHFMLESF